LARLEPIRAIHNTQESGGHQKELNTKRRPGTEASEITPGPVRGVGEVSVPDSEIGCCVPLRRYRRRGVGADGHAAAVTTDPSLYARRRDGIAPGPVLKFATSFCGPYFSNLTSSRASTEESIRPMEWLGTSAARSGADGITFNEL
jgi:hypothetical protein